MAHKKGVGSTDNGRDSISKRLGVKLFGGQAAKAGNIIIRQRGTKYHPGENVYMGKDYTIHAKVDGSVSFRKGRLNRMFVSVVPAGAEAAAPEKIAQVTPPADSQRTPVVDTTPGQPASGSKITLPNGKKVAQDDLKLIEGIGPKIEGLLQDGGITTWEGLATAELDKVQAILDEAGPRYKIHNPATWAQQARLAADGQWEELLQLQDELDGGKEKA